MITGCLGTVKPDGAGVHHGNLEQRAGIVGFGRNETRREAVRHGLARVGEIGLDDRVVLGARSIRKCCLGLDRLVAASLSPWG